MKAPRSCRPIGCKCNSASDIALIDTTHGRVRVWIGDWRHHADWRHDDVIIQLTKRANNNVASDHVISEMRRRKYISDMWKIVSIRRHSVCMSSSGNLTLKGILLIGRSVLIGLHRTIVNRLCGRVGPMQYVIYTLWRGYFTCIVCWSLVSVMRHYV